jgi:hypothetical protein
MSPITILLILVIAAFIWFKFLRGSVAGRGDSIIGSDGSSRDGGFDSNCDSSSDGGYDGGGD